MKNEELDNQHNEIERLKKFNVAHVKYIKEKENEAEHLRAEIQVCFFICNFIYVNNIKMILKNAIFICNFGIALGILTFWYLFWYVCMIRYSFRVSGVKFG